MLSPWLHGTCGLFWHHYIYIYIYIYISDSQQLKNISSIWWWLLRSPLSISISFSHRIYNGRFSDKTLGRAFECARDTSVSMEEGRNMKKEIRTKRRPENGIGNHQSVHLRGAKYDVSFGVSFLFLFLFLFFFKFYSVINNLFFSLTIFSVTWLVFIVPFNLAPRIWFPNLKKR